MPPTHKNGVMSQIIQLDNLPIFMALLVASTTLLTVYREWRIILPALIVQYLALAVLADLLGANADVRLGSDQVSLATFLKASSGAISGLVLLLTAFAINSEIRRRRKADAAAREDARAGLRRFLYEEEAVEAQRFGYLDYVLPVVGIAIAAGVSFGLAAYLPFVDIYLRNWIFYWLITSGIVTLVQGREVLKLGTGLLVCLNGVDWLYSLLRTGDSPVVLGVSAGVTITLALLVSYLAVLFYARTRSLDLSVALKRPTRR